RETTRMIVRAALTGKGTVYFDDVSLAVVGSREVAISNPHDPQTAHLIARRLPVTKDCMVLAYLPGWNHGEVDNLGVSDNSGGVRTLLAWEMPSPKEVDDVELRFILALYCRRSLLRDGPGRLEIYKLLGEWGERTSWNSQPDISHESAASCDVPSGEGWKMLDVTDVVREQARTPHANFGVALGLPAKKTDQDTWSEIDFISRESDSQGLRPMLLVVRPDPESPER
ncbi:MAG: DUF7594 domain-containing protein, partial [Pirellulales bacterium]